MRLFAQRRDTALPDPRRTRDALLGMTVIRLVKFRYIESKLTHPAILAWFATCVALIAFLIYFRRGEILLYGDAVAHINIARRVFDSRTPGLLQLGTVWLPLPHLLMIPFLLSTWMWRTGVGGSVPSMAAYIAGVVGIFRLVREALDTSGRREQLSRIAAWVAAILYGANPNLLYLQSTGMTELLYLSLFIWVVVYFLQFVQNSKAEMEGKHRSLLKCGACVGAACFTRYDGWFLAGTLVASVSVISLRRAGRIVPTVRNFALLALAAPILWVCYNGVIYRNPLEFVNGPYSASAIEQRNSPSGAAAHPGTGSVVVAGLYFLKSAELNAGPEYLGNAWLLLALGGLVISLSLAYRGPRGGSADGTAPGAPRNAVGVEFVPNAPWPLLLLWIPLPFYALSIAYGHVPVFVPVWWPFSLYNVRYGLELLPALAVFAALAFYFLAVKLRSPIARFAIAASVILFALSNYAFISKDPVCRREARINSRARIALESELAAYLTALPPASTLLMYLGDHVGALQRAGIPLGRVINEGNHLPWRLPSDPEGLWERALANPEKYVDYVVAFDGDPVSGAVDKEHLKALALLHIAGGPRNAPAATMYQVIRHPGGR
jgi:hypothetical protein